MTFIIDQQITLDMVKNALLIGSPKVIKLLLRQDSSNVVIERIKAEWIKEMLSKARGTIFSKFDIFTCYTNSVK